MKLHVPSLQKTVLLLLAGFACTTSLGYADKTNSPAAAAKGKQATPPAPVEIPKSVFVAPTDPSVGKDPFFPRSGYPYIRTTTVSTTSKTNPVVTVPELVLSGISGTQDKPLAVINNSTFSEGDVHNVFVSGGRQILVQCLEIDLQGGTALVQVSGQRKILPLKSKK